MAEQIAIARIGHRGDGVADTPAGPIYVPYTLPGETVEVEPLPGHPDRRHLLRVERRAPSASRRSARISAVCGGCALQHWSAARYRDWKRELVVEALAQAGLDAPVAGLIDAHGEGRRRAVFHARRGTHDVLEVGFAALRATIWWRSTAVRCWRRPGRIDRSRLGDRRGARRESEAARHPGDGDGSRASTSTCAARGR